MHNVKRAPKRPSDNIFQVIERPFDEDEYFGEMFYQWIWSLQDDKRHIIKEILQGKAY